VKAKVDTTYTSRSAFSFHSSVSATMHTMFGGRRISKVKHIALEEIYFHDVNIQR
jgi:hypothetical protein